MRLALTVISLCFLTLSAHAEETTEELTAKAEQGDAVAQYNLYLRIKPQSVDKTKWLLKAGEQGHKQAQFELGQCYWHGTFVEKNGAEACKWFVKAAERGYPVALLYLGNAYLEGFGVEKNDVLAYQWNSLAVASSQDKAIENLTDKQRAVAKERLTLIEAKLSDKLRAEGQRLATEWQAAFEKRQQQNK